MIGDDLRRVLAAHLELEELLHPFQRLRARVIAGVQEMIELFKLLLRRQRWDAEWEVNDLVQILERFHLRVWHNSTNTERRLLVASGSIYNLLLFTRYKREYTPMYLNALPCSVLLPAIP